MAWFDLDLGGFNLGGGASLPTGGIDWGFDWDMPSLKTPSMDWWKGGGFDLGDWGKGVLPGASGGSGGGGFSLPGFVREWGPVFGLAKEGLGAGLGIMSQMGAREYQNQLQEYYRNRQEIERQHNEAMMGYIQRRSDWEANMMGQAGEMMGRFGESMSAFQEQIGGILAEQIEAAKPLLAQSRELLEPAVAALAKGEVPELFAPILEQAKARARAAAMQQYASAGIDAGTAAASVEGLIDQQAQQMLLAAATQMLTGGQGLAQSGGTFLAQGAQTASLGITPVVAEFQAMLAALGSLFGGGMPSLSPGTPPPPPVA